MHKREVLSEIRSDKGRRKLFSSPTQTLKKMGNTQILTVIQYNQQPYGGQGEVYFNAGIVYTFCPFSMRYRALKYLLAPN